jgi:hypothetical protein
MNQQLIKQFERQSNLDVYSLGLDKVKWESRLEEYTQLIIQECNNALSPMLRDMISRGHAYDLIKEHFGVKE